MAKRLKNKKGFLSLVGMVLALAITCYLVYLVLNAYMSQSYLGRSKKNTDGRLSKDKTKNNADDVFLEQDIDRSSPKATIESTVNKFKDIQEERFKQLEETEKNLKQ